MVRPAAEEDDTLSNDVLCQIATTRQDPAVSNEQQEEANKPGHQSTTTCSRERTSTATLVEGMDDNLAKVLARRSHGVAISEDDVFTGNDEEAVIDFGPETEQGDGVPGAYAGGFGREYNRVQKALPRELRGDATKRQHMEQSGRSTTSRTQDDTDSPPEGSAEYWFRDWDEQQKKNRNKVYLLIGSLLLIVAAVVLPMVFLLGRDKGKDTEDPILVANFTRNGIEEFSLVPNLTQHTLDALADPHSYQWWAYSWVEVEPDWDAYSPWRQQQRFALACIYFAFHSLRFNKLKSDYRLSLESFILGLNGLFICENGDIGCHDTGEIKSLDLTHKQKLVGVLPQQVAFLSRLEAIDFSTAFIGKDLETLLPLGGVANALPALQTLNLSGCGLTGTIPSTLGLLTSLVTVDLSKNDLTSTIPQQIGELPSLNVFRVDNNTNLEAFVPEGFCNENHSRIEMFSTSWCWSIGQCCS